MDLLRDSVLGMAFCVVGGFLPAMRPKFVDLTGKIAVVTGSNSGVGYGLALQLAEMGATVYLACRNKDRAAQARTSMLEECPGAKIEAVDLVR
jgi:NAD(P)-dependent dehydrogenase (short-subunit alcohol dehydrogenase family)